MTAIFDGADRYQQSVTPGTDIAQSTLTTDGVWFSCCVYVASAPSASTGLWHIGSGSFGNICGLITNASGEPRCYFRRSGGTGWQAVSGIALISGWNVVTGWIRRGSGAGLVSVSLWHNGESVVESLDNVQSVDISSNFGTLYAGSIGTGNYLTGELSGMAFGTGNPASAHAYAWNSGTVREIDGYNFAGDANATLDYYAPWDKEGTDTVDTGDTELLDTVNSLDSWTFGGSPVWSTRVAPFNAGVTPETGTNGTPAMTDGTSLSIACTLATNTWNTPAVDTNDISVWSTKGYGRITVSSASVSGDGTSTATADITLSRTVYSDEELIVSLASGWLTDGDGNEGAVGTDVDVTTTNAAAGPPSTSTGASWGKCSWDFSEAVPVKFYLEGGPCAVKPSGSFNITASYPAESTRSGDVINGMMKNPIGNGSQGYDEGQSTWDAADQASYPLSVSANDSVIKAISRDDPTATPGDPGFPVYIDEYRGLNIVASAPAANELAPPYVGYDGTSPRPTYTVDVDAVLAILPEYAVDDLTDYSGTPVTAPAVADMEARFCQMCSGRYITTAVSYRQLIHAGWTHEDGYHQYNSDMTGSVLCRLISDTGGNEAKRDLVIWTCHHAIQTWHWRAQNGSGWRENNQGWIGLVAAGMAWTSYEDRLNDIRTTVGGKELLQSYEWTQDDLDGLAPHDEADNHSGYERLMYKRKTITAVNGADITCSGMGSFETGDGLFRDVILTDGTSEWFISQGDFNDSTKTFTLPTAAHGLSVDDVVWAILPYTPEVGDADWGLRHWATDGTINQPSVSSGHNSLYRSLEKWAGAALALEALGLKQWIEWDPFFDYVRRANTDDEPTATYEFPSHQPRWDGTVNFSEAMWNVHGDTIEGTEAFDPASIASSDGGASSGGNAAIALEFRRNRVRAKNRLIYALAHEKWGRKNDEDDAN